MSSFMERREQVKEFFNTLKKSRCPLCENEPTIKEPDDDFGTPLIEIKCDHCLLGMIDVVTYKGTRRELECRDPNYMTVMKYNIVELVNDWNKINSFREALVKNRIAAPFYGYPMSEAKYLSIGEWEKETGLNFVEHLLQTSGGLNHGC